MSNTKHHRTTEVIYEDRDNSDNNNSIQCYYIREDLINSNSTVAVVVSVSAAKAVAVKVAVAVVM